MNKKEAVWLRRLGWDIGGHLLVSPLPIVGAVWLKKRNWIRRLSMNVLCIFFTFVFVLADVGTTFLLVKEYMRNLLDNAIEDCNRVGH